MSVELSRETKNVSIVGHADSGKTTLADALLFKMGAVKRAGSVKAKNSLFDYDEMEKEHGHSIDSAIAHGEWDGKNINIIDTPGYPDYVGDAVAAIAASEGVLVCINGLKGVEVTTRRVMRVASDLGKARVIVVTKCDQESVNIPEIVASIREWFGEVCIPITLPHGVGPAIKDRERLLKTKGGETEEGKAYYQNFIESAVEVDEEVMVRYLDGQEISPEDLRRCCIKAVKDGALVPIIFAAVEIGEGSADVLNAIEDLFPGADYAAGRRLWDNEAGEGEPVASISVADDAPFYGQVFKVKMDKHLGRVSYLRVLSGSIHAGDYFHHAGGGRKEKIGHLARPMGEELEAIETGRAGDILALTKIDGLEINDTIGSELSPLYLRPIPFPQPMTQLAVRAGTRADETKISECLNKFASESGTFRFERNPVTHEAIASGMSQLHLDTIFKRLEQRYGVKAETAPARIPYREGIVGASNGHYRHKKQSGGRGQFAEVHLEVAPAEEGAGLDFQWKITGGAIPTNFAPAVEKGIRERMDAGVIAGYPLSDVTVRVTDGKFHDVDSSEAAFKIAGARAFVDAVSKAQPVLLEPVVDLEVTLPAESFGDISADLTTRRGHISGMEAKGRHQIIMASVPQSSMSEYPRILTALTSGEGSFSYEVKGYERVPRDVQKEIESQFKIGEVEA